MARHIIYREIPTSGFDDSSDDSDPDSLFVEDATPTAGQGELIPVSTPDGAPSGAFSYPVIPVISVGGHTYQFVFWNWLTTPARPGRTPARVGDSHSIVGIADGAEDFITLWYERIDPGPVGTGGSGVTVRGFSVPANKFFRRPPIASVTPPEAQRSGSFVDTGATGVTIEPRGEYVLADALQVHFAYAFERWLGAFGPRNPITHETLASPHDLTVAKGRSRHAIALYQWSGRTIDTVEPWFAAVLAGGRIDLSKIIPHGPEPVEQEQAIAAVFARALVDVPTRMIAELRPRVRALIEHLTAIDHAIARKE